MSDPILSIFEVRLFLEFRFNTFLNNIRFLYWLLCCIYLFYKLVCKIVSSRSLSVVSVFFPGLSWSLVSLQQISVFRPYTHTLALRRPLGSGKRTVTPFLFLFYSSRNSSICTQISYQVGRVPSRKQILFTFVHRCINNISSKRIYQFLGHVGLVH